MCAPYCCYDYENIHEIRGIGLKPIHATTPMCKLLRLRQPSPNSWLPKQPTIRDPWQSAAVVITSLCRRPDLARRPFFSFTFARVSSNANVASLMVFHRFSNFLGGCVPLRTRQRWPRKRPMLMLRSIRIEYVGKLEDLYAFLWRFLACIRYFVCWTWRRHFPRNIP